jgi:hypothetical protein
MEYWSSLPRVTCPVRRQGRGGPQRRRLLWEVLEPRQLLTTDAWTADA